MLCREAELLKAEIEEELSKRKIKIPKLFLGHQHEIPIELVPLGGNIFLFEGIHFSKYKEIERPLNLALHPPTGGILDQISDYEG